jgi:hypothetical protein
MALAYSGDALRVQVVFAHGGQATIENVHDFSEKADGTLEIRHVDGGTAALFKPGQWVACVRLEAAK